MLKTILFDFGNVFVSDTTEQMESEFGYERLSAKQKRDYLKSLHESELGKTPSSEVLKAIQRTLMPEQSLKQIETYILKSRLLPPWKLANKLSKRYRIIVVSNCFKGWPEKLGKRLRVNFHKFPFINSAEVGLRKPDLKFFRYVLKTYKLKPSETLFIDDRPHNIAAAKKLGIKTIWYRQNYKALPEQLKKFDVI